MEGYCVSLRRERRKVDTHRQKRGRQPVLEDGREHDGAESENDRLHGKNEAETGESASAQEPVVSPKSVVHLLRERSESRSQKTAEDRAEIAEKSSGRRVDYQREKHEGRRRNVIETVDSGNGDDGAGEDPTPTPCGLFVGGSRFTGISGNRRVERRVREGGLRSVREFHGFGELVAHSKRTLARFSRVRRAPFGGSRREFSPGRSSQQMPAQGDGRQGVVEQAENENILEEIKRKQKAGNRMLSQIPKQIRQRGRHVNGCESGEDQEEPKLGLLHGNGIVQAREETGGECSKQHRIVSEESVQISQ